MPTHLHYTPHISATSHLISAPEPPEPPYEPSFYPPAGHWSSAEKALFFHALGAHSRLRPDLIAADIGTKSTADVAIYISLLREGAARAKDSDVPAGILRDRHPAAHQVSSELVAFEDQHAARICAAEPVGAHELWRGERDVECAREDLIARLDAVGLQVLDRILRQDEERRTEAGSIDEEESEGEGHARGRRGPSTTLHSAADASSRTIEPQATTSNTSSPSVVPIPDDDIEDVTDTIRSDLSPTSRRRIYKRLHMRLKRAEASGGVAKLDPARLKPGRKVSATSKFRMPHVKDEDESVKRRERGNTRPYKIQRELERLGIDAEYLRENGLGLFHLGALGRLMRLYPSLDASRPSGVAESIAAETIQMLRALVVRFVRSLVQRAIAVRELDFALRAHTKVWRLGDRVVRPPHVRRALELSGCARLNKRAHFERLLERFSEDKERTGDGGEDDERGEDEGNDDVLLAARATMRDGEAIAEQEDDDDDKGQGNSDGGVSEAEQQQKAGPSNDAQVHESAEVGWSTNHRAMYSPFVYAPDMIAPAHPFGVYATGTTPESLGFSAHARNVADKDEDEDDLMPAETDDEALAVELLAEDRLDEADAREDAAYEASVWREFRGVHDADVLLPPQTLGKRSACEEVGGNDNAPPMPARKRGKRNPRGGRTPVDARAKASSVKSAAVIEDSDLEYLD